MILFDGTHLATTGGLNGLHVFALKAGLSRRWFQDHPRHPHYDVFGHKVRLVLRSGALEKNFRRVSSRELILRLKGVPA